MLLFDVTGLRSDDCSRRLQESVSARDPDAVVVVMRVAGRASIDTTLTPDEAIEAIADAGFAATPAYGG